MPDTFAQYLEKWLRLSTAQGLNNPLVKMPVKRFRLLQPIEFASITDGGTMILGTMSDPIARNLHKYSQTRIRERGEHCTFICSGAVEMTVAAAVGQQPRTALFPVCLKRASLQTSGDKVRAAVSEDETWQFNPVLASHLRSFGISVPDTLATNPQQAASWVKAQLGNRASSVTSDSYIGLFSSQQMVFQQRLTETPIRRALARNPVVRAKIQGERVKPVELGDVTDDGLEELGLVLPCDDSQLRVLQLADQGCCLQVEGPPGTGKSQTIANIISNALSRGRSALLVCDKKAAIVQVEERLTNCGLKPALLNLHDEDLDKREFLKQATDRFPVDIFTPVQETYSFEHLCNTRKTLNDRVRFGREITHPSLQVRKFAALGGLIQLRKELKNVPKVAIANWQSLSRERLRKLLSSLAEWPGLAEVLQDANNVWNKVRFETFDDPNAKHELETQVQELLKQIEALDQVREWKATVGVELPLESDEDVKRIVSLVEIVLSKPACHPTIIGNSHFNSAELERLESAWATREQLLAARHPVQLTVPLAANAEGEAQALLSTEHCRSWQDLSEREVLYENLRAEVEDFQKRYERLCAQIGLGYSPSIKVRRAQLRAVLTLGKLQVLIPRSWWEPTISPVLSVNGWIGKLRACFSQAKASPLPLHVIALERVASTHWQHVEAMAEHGFNLVSYCLKFVDDRKCKLALRQVYPDIPAHKFKQWREVTLNAVAARETVKSLRAAAECHFRLRELTDNYLPVAHEVGEGAEQFTNYYDSVQPIRNAAALVEQWRTRNDLFEVGGVHWQTFWESPNLNVLLQVRDVLSALNKLPLPSEQPDNVEGALAFLEKSRERIHGFLQTCEETKGDRTQSVSAAFAAKKEFVRCSEILVPLPKYLELQNAGTSEPDWQWLRKTIAWRDHFEGLCDKQKLDVDSPLWSKLQDWLRHHQSIMAEGYEKLGSVFDDCLSSIGGYESLRSLLDQMLKELPRLPLWLEKKRWEKKLRAFPELEDLWRKVTTANVDPEQAERLFCFNLLRLSDPIAEPHGPELKQTLTSFVHQDEKLASWVLHHLKSKLGQAMHKAAINAARSEADLRHLSGLKRIRGTVRELVNAHLDYLLAAKPCWMVSPTSLANLIDSAIFEKHGVPFDMVIFDEASQIRVLDGLLSMSFGKQVIIVGDRHQLPPTDFFASFVNPTEEAETDGFGVSESILDEFSGAFEPERTNVMLMSHYRSETPDLIRFSNDWFYKGALETYPPAHVGGIGRRLHYAPNGVYSEKGGQHTNPVEAKEIVKLIELHVRECPSKSLGVVTMNLPQMELIDSELQMLTTEAVRAFVADESKFFNRNLETVQGDEMDRIILGLTYGKNSAGQFNAAVLGPLTKSGGDRRLNVALTRSRSGMIVVSSLKTGDLEASGAQSKGFHCLKALLSDMENNLQVGSFGIGSKRFEKQKDGVSDVIHCDSPFEEQVVEFLENEGYEIECQYGAGKFRLDIVVKEHGRNLLAIECDGAGYHSSLIARTRDRARQRLLEKLGWRFYRVWSTNWWFYEQQEKEAIIAAINQARVHASTARVRK